MNFSYVALVMIIYRLKNTGPGESILIAIINMIYSHERQTIPQSDIIIA